VRAAAVVIAAVLFSCAQAWAESSGAILWRDNDDLPIAEPSEDDDGDYVWWDGVHNMALYPLGRVLDLGNVLRTLGEWTRAVGPAEAANLNALDEVPDSTWFTNRHARHPPRVEVAPRDGSPQVVRVERATR
jgi:hypothetical protein